MKTKIIHNSRVGLSNVASVFCAKTTTWAMEMAQDDQKERLELLRKGLKAKKAFIQYCAQHQLSQADVERYFEELADNYNICLK